ncbi:hypothetical protein BDP27DRAFT_1421182 [Rhodocollybia butyracea]|uniref:Uncharacterized protein n=1 Tax=Rhodocollybia butyracea TaxID=206335 RepID=A0A9P5PW84_9AGAR|nr:hypothetical protein BDP27DRAFT_1421182 [Rhodocollybia butyracea]
MLTSLKTFTPKRIIHGLTLNKCITIRFAQTQIALKSTSPPSYKKSPDTNRHLEATKVRKPTRRTSFRYILSSIKKLIDRDPDVETLKSFVHYNLGDSTSRQKEFSAVFSLLVSRCRYAEATSVWLRMRASQAGLAHHLLDDALMLCLALRNTKSTGSSTDTGSILSIFSLIFSSPLFTENQFLSLIRRFPKFEFMDDDMKLRVVFLWIWTRSNQADVEALQAGAQIEIEPDISYIPQQPIISLLASLLTKLGRVDDALEVTERWDELRKNSQFTSTSTVRSHTSMAQSHTYTSILTALPASDSHYPANESEENLADITDRVLATIAARDITSDKSLFNSLMGAMRKRARAQGQERHKPIANAANSRPHAPNNKRAVQRFDDDPEEIERLWDSVSGDSSAESQKFNGKNQKAAVEQAFTLYHALCAAHADSDGYGPSTPEAVSTSPASMPEEYASEAVESVSTWSTSGLRPDFRPNFYTYRTLWDLLVRRPKWRFDLTRSASSLELSPEGSPLSTTTPKKVFEDEYGFDLSDPSDQEDLGLDRENMELPIGSDYAEDESSRDDHPETTNESPILPPRQLFYDMMRHHFSHLGVRSHKSSRPLISRKALSQAQSLLNTALLTFLNRSRSSNGETEPTPDYAAALVVVRCFAGGSAGRFSVFSDPTSTVSTTLSRSSSGSSTKTNPPSPSQLPLHLSTHLPLIHLTPRTYRIIITHLHQRVRDSLKVALRFSRKNANPKGAVGCSTWAHWLLSMGSSDLRGFRQLLDARPQQPHSNHSESLAATPRESEGIKHKSKKSWSRLPQEKIIERLLNVSRYPIRSETLGPSNSGVKTGFEPDCDIPSYSQITRHNHSLPATPHQNSLPLEPLERMIFRAWVAHYYPALTFQSEEGSGKLNEISEKFESEVERAGREMVPIQADISIILHVSN